MSLHQLDYRTDKDTGENEAAAISPYTDGEPATGETFQRPVEQNRVRGEVIRERLRELVVGADIDRVGPLLWGGGNVVFDGADPGAFTIAASLFVAPFATAGGEASAPFIASTQATLKIGTVSNNQIILTSVKKQWEGSTFPAADANALSVEIVDTGAGPTVTVTGATGDINNIKVEINSGTTTCQEVVDAITAHGTANTLVSAAVEAGSTASNPCNTWTVDDWGTPVDYTKRFLSGGLAGITHEIPATALVNFFAASSDNKLVKGDTLAIRYENNIDTTSTGGRYQSTVENANTELDMNQLVNLRRYPEQAVNCIPICKRIDADTLIFANGAYIKQGVADSTLAVDSEVRTVIEAGGGVQAEVIAARTSPVYGGPKASLTLRIDEADAEINTARTSSMPTTGGLKANLNARINVVETEVAAARNSGIYGDQSTVDVRVNQVENEVFNARDGETNLITKLQAIESAIGSGASGYAVTCGTGGEYTNLETCLAALEAANGGVVHLKGSHALTANRTYTKPLTIVGMDDTAWIDLGSYNLTLAAYSHLWHVHLDGTGTVTLGTYGTLQSAIVRPAVKTSLGVTISNCNFQTGSYVMLVDGTLEDCVFSGLTGAATRIDTTNTTKLSSIRNCIMTLPSTGANKAIGHFAGMLDVKGFNLTMPVSDTITDPAFDIHRAADIRNVNVLLTGSGTIKQGLMGLDPDLPDQNIIFDNLTIDANTNSIAVRPSFIKLSTNTGRQHVQLSRVNWDYVIIPIGGDAFNTTDYAIRCDTTVTSDSRITIDHVNIGSIIFASAPSASTPFILFGCVNRTSDIYLKHVHIQESPQDTAQGGARHIVNSTGSDTGRLYIEDWKTGNLTGNLWTYIIYTENNRVTLRRSKLVADDAAAWSSKSIAFFSGDQIEISDNRIYVSEEAGYVIHLSGCINVICSNNYITKVEGSGTVVLLYVNSCTYGTFMGNILLTGGSGGTPVSYGGTYLVPSTFSTTNVTT